MCGVTPHIIPNNTNDLGVSRRSKAHEADPGLRESTCSD
jgi:hypothetical protein